MQTNQQATKMTRTRTPSRMADPVKRSRNQKPDHWQRVDRRSPFAG